MTEKFGSRYSGFEGRRGIERPVRNFGRLKCCRNSLFFTHGELRLWFWKQRSTHEEFSDNMLMNETAKCGIVERHSNSWG
jgi:hypothetical protein